MVLALINIKEIKISLKKFIHILQNQNKPRIVIVFEIIKIQTKICSSVPVRVNKLEIPFKNFSATSASNPGLIEWK